VSTSILTSKTKILFLDFDGVLHPLNALENELFSRASTLELALKNLPCNIVITSNWRITHSVESMSSKLPPEISKRIVGVTEVIESGRHNRFKEITQYLIKNELHNVSWRALDDSHFEFPHNCINLIRCDANIGLSLNQQEIITKWLVDQSGF